MKNKFCFVAPMYNASKTLERMLHSLYGQSYENWRLILIDDISDKKEIKDCKQIISKFQKLNDSRITNVWNIKKKWEVANVLNGISMCDDDDIICRIDADDALCDLDALAMIDATYNHTKCDALWTAHRWGLSDKNISGPMPDNVNPYVHPWVSSHLKTFRKYLLNNVNDKNFKNANGEFFKRIGDQAIYLPVLTNAKKYVFLPRVIYHYTINDVPETYQTSDAKFQRDEALFLRERGYVL